ncbi:hypothetical protein [Pantoea eucalypti]|uniref:hypothetical protein n=1 Tax=Pantoea eucalypti TaxID=470933 RepID=UPI00289C051B|nr:hypothetical protein [Pantoea eucalypti]
MTKDKVEKQNQHSFKAIIILCVLYFLLFAFFSYSLYFSKEFNDWSLVTLNLIYGIFGMRFVIQQRKKEKNPSDELTLAFVMALAPLGVGLLDIVKRVLMSEPVADFIDFHPKGWIATGILLLCLIFLAVEIAIAHHKMAKKP